MTEQITAIPKEAIDVTRTSLGIILNAIDAAYHPIRKQRQALYQMIERNGVDWYAQMKPNLPWYLTMGLRTDDIVLNRLLQANI